MCRFMGLPHTESHAVQKMEAHVLERRFKAAKINIFILIMNHMTPSSMTLQKHFSLALATNDKNTVFGPI